MEPQKPFACTIPECGMSFTNEDHLHVHTKKHDMVLQLGMEQKAAFAADQTPTPTRFIRNCEEVGLFQDLQNVNPFDEGFKRAMDAKHNVLSLDSSSEDVLHTPHLTFPLDADCTLYTANNQRNITISRSSSDESGAVKEYETTTISKLTNEVTTISRLVKPDSDEAKHDKKDVENVSYTNNVIKIHEIRKDGKVNMEVNEAGKKDIPPMMSQKSLDYVVDSLTGDVTDDGRIKQEVNDKDDIEVTIKLPSGKRFKMQVVDEAAESDTKEILRNLLSNKKKAASSAKPRGKARGATGPAIRKDQDPLRCEKLNPPVATPVAMGTLIPVKLINALPVAHKIPIIAMQKAPVPGTKVPKPVHKVPSQPKVNGKVGDKSEGDKSECRTDDVSDGLAAKRSYSSASSKRYREKWRQAKWMQQEEIMRLKDANMTLSSENTVLRMVLAKHLNTCPAGDDLRDIQKRLMNFEKVVVVPKV